MSHAAPALVVEDARKSYGDDVALVDVTLSLGAGDCLALVGESGAGKSTLLRCVNRLEELDGGRIYCGGVDVSTRDAVALRRSIGYVPQEGGLLPHWTAARNVGLVPRLLKRSDAGELAERALRLVGLDPEVFASRWPGELSGGQRQRVALARALAAGQSLLLLDEPFGALDAITRATLQSTLNQVRRTRPLTIVLVTHDLREALLLADVIGVMRAGRLEQLASARLLRDAPGTPYVAELLEQAGLGR